MPYGGFRMVKTIALCSLAAAAAAVVPAAPAAALVTPPMTLTITPSATHHTVCASGTASPVLYLTADWELTITGERSNVSPILQTASATSRTFSVCQNVLKLGAAQGQYWVTFEFVGAGSDVVGKWTGYGAWQPVLADVALTLPA